MARRWLVIIMVILLPVISSGQYAAVQGYVLDKKSGKGIAGVVVSDGYNVVATNTKGRYSFFRHPSAAFVFISAPAGFRIAHAEGVPSFYTKLGEGRSYDFYLEKETVSDQKHLLLVGADPQPMTNEDGKKWLSFAQQYFQPVLERHKGIPALGIMCGDIVGDTHELYKNHKQALKAIGIPFFQVFGNHDADYGARTDELSQHSFREAFGPEYYSFNKGRIHYVVLDNVFYLGKNFTYTGYVTETQLAWLEKDLKHIPQGSTVIVSTHIPVDFDTTTVAGSKDAQESAGISNKEHLYSILAPYKTHFMSGHTHWNRKFENKAGFHHIHGAMCGEWWQSPASSDGTPLGFGVYEIDGDNLTWYFQSAGEDRDFQMRVYQPDSSGRFIVNIWNWDAGWKAVWQEDGRNAGELKRFAGYDPFISAFNKTLPQSWSWVKPSLTTHLFEGKIKPGTKSVTVKATDRFGKIYTASIGIMPQ
ncbi:MAG: calcineurin-like phosphoesterase family protein [Chitinophagaceae bacterium]